MTAKLRFAGSDAPSTSRLTQNWLPTSAVKVPGALIVRVGWAPALVRFRPTTTVDAARARMASARHRASVRMRCAMTGLLRRPVRDASDRLRRLRTPGSGRGRISRCATAPSSRCAQCCACPIQKHASRRTRPRWWSSTVHDRARRTEYADDDPAHTQGRCSKKNGPDRRGDRARPRKVVSGPATARQGRTQGTDSLASAFASVEEAVDAGSADAAVGGAALAGETITTPVAEQSIGAQVRRAGDRCRLGRRSGRCRRRRRPCPCRRRRR